MGEDMRHAVFPIRERSASGHYTPDAALLRTAQVMDAELVSSVLPTRDTRALRCTGLIYPSAPTIGRCGVQALERTDLTPRDETCNRQVWLAACGAIQREEALRGDALVVQPCIQAIHDGLQPGP